MESEKFIQELAWRDFWRSYAYHHPNRLWTDVENYKTGFQASHYQDVIPEDIESAKPLKLLILSLRVKKTAICTIMRECIWLPM